MGLRLGFGVGSGFGVGFRLFWGFVLFWAFPVKLLFTSLFTSSETKLLS